MYANAIVEMLCKYFKYQVDLEESDWFESDLLKTSPASRYDFIIWRLVYIKSPSQTMNDRSLAPIVVIETKHGSLHLKAVAQAVAYYARANKGKDQMNCSFTFTQSNRIIEMIPPPTSNQRSTT